MPQQRLQFGEAVSATLMDVVRRLPSTLGFLISKGGITSNDVLAHGLELSAARVLGQILPGVTVVQTPPGHRLPGLPVVIFPGNVGDADALAESYRLLAGRPDSAGAACRRRARARHAGGPLRKNICIVCLARLPASGFHSLA